MTTSLMWDLNTRERIRNFTWWWWWWLLLIRDPQVPRRTRQLMILWSTKDVDRITVNDHPWVREKDIVREGDETRFDGMTAAWFFDGKRMHEPFVLERNDFTVRRLGGDGARLTRVEDGSVLGDRGELVPASPNILTFSGDPEEYRVRIRKEDWDLQFRLTPWNDFVSRPRYKSAHYVGKYGYNILRLYGSKLAGSIEHGGRREEVEGTAYFQKVMVNAPATPWYWGMFHVEDGSFIDFFNPHVGPQMRRRTAAPRSWWDWGELKLSKHAQFYIAPEDRVFEMRKLKVKKGFTSENLPIFKVRAWAADRSAELELVAEAYSRATWRFEQKYLRWFTSILHYNEYPVEVKELTFREGGRRITRDDLGFIAGNCEHTWGKLL